MTSRERVEKAFRFLPADRTPVFDLVQGMPRGADHSDIVLVDGGNASSKRGPEKFNMLAIMDPFEDISRAFGLEEILFRIGNDPEGVFAELSGSAEKTIGKAEDILKNSSDIDGVWLWGDMAYNTGAYFSKEFYLEYLYPLHKGICSFFSSYDMPVVLHSDGNLNGILPYLVQAGFNGLHPLEAAASMDLGSIAGAFSKKIVLFSNISADLLRGGSIEKVFQKAAEKLDIAGRSGGYVFGFDAPISDDIDYGKYESVMRFVREYGRGKRGQCDRREGQNKGIAEEMHGLHAVC